MGFLNQKKNEVKWAFQRMHRGWDDRDVWDISICLSRIIPEMVLSLKEKGEGFPASLVEDEDWDKTKNSFREGAEERLMQEWETILDKIAEGFGEYRELIESGRSCFGEATENKKFQEAFDLLREHFGSLWV